MKIAIHSNQNSFSSRWIGYCQAQGIDFKIVNCYSSGIMEELADCDGLMWHFNHKNPKDSKLAKELLFSVETSGKIVFPNYHTCWHFDDKLAQKYLFESIGAPLANVYSFYDKKTAIKWADETSFPKVFKLRNGAGSDNVRLVKSKSQALSLINKAFGKGFKQYDGWGNLKERYRKYRLGKARLWDLVKGIIRLFHTTDYARIKGREKGYVLFQDFISGNDSDIRIIVIGDKAFAIKRMVRENDFRASGSGWVLYDKELFSEDTIRLAFKMADQLKSQCAAFDFVYDNNHVFVLEVSYGFVKEVYDPCVGYWDKELNWYEGPFNPYGWMVERLMDQINKNKLIKYETAREKE